jgi:hypothetical protein
MFSASQREASAEEMHVDGGQPSLFGDKYAGCQVEQLE